MYDDSPRQRVWQSIHHQQPQRVPHHIIYTIPVKETLERHFGSEDLDNILDNHIVKYRLRMPDVEIRPDFWRDGFNVVWNRSIDKDIGTVESYMMKKRSMAGIHFPNPKDERIYMGLSAFLQNNSQRYCIASVGFALFERSWSLRRMEELLVDMIEDPVWVEHLMDAITEYQLAVLDEALKYPLDGILFGDDWGQQSGLIFSPRLWRRFIKPRLARMFAKVKSAGKAVFLHSCGKIQALFPDLIEIGLDVFNPFQPEVMDVTEAKKQYGRHLCFYGGVSIQKLLPYGTPQEIHSEVRRLMKEIGQGGGYIVAPSHAMPPDIPLENILAFIETVQNQ